MDGASLVDTLRDLWNMQIRSESRVDAYLKYYHFQVSCVGPFSMTRSFFPFLISFFKRLLLWFATIYTIPRTLQAPGGTKRSLDLQIFRHQPVDQVTSHD